MELLLNLAATLLGLGLLFFLAGAVTSRFISKRPNLLLSMGGGVLAGGIIFLLNFLLSASGNLESGILAAVAAMLGTTFGLRSGLFRKFSGENFGIFFARRITFKSHRSVSRLVVILSLLTISLGVAVMEISISIVAGFKTEIQNKVVGFGSHIQIGNYLAELESSVTPLPLNNDFIPRVKKMEGVVSAEPYIMLPAMLKSPETMEGIMLKGVLQDYNWEFFQEKLVAGTLPDFSDQDESKQVLISRKLANLLLLDVNSKARVFFMDKKPRVRQVVVAGIYETGLEEFDAVTIVCDLRMLQRILNWEKNEVAGFEVKLTSLDLLDSAVSKILVDLPPEYDAYPITRLFPELFDWLELQNQNVWAILILMTLIAVINMSSVVLILIIERTQTIGLLKSMGLSNDRVVGIFILNAMILVAFGVLAGNLVGLGLIWLQDVFGMIQVDQENYFVSTVPVKWVWDSFFLVNVGVVLICTLCMFFPTLIITRISPVRAIRFN